MFTNNIAYEDSSHPYNHTRWTTDTSVYEPFNRKNGRTNTNMEFIAKQEIYGLREKV